MKTLLWIATFLFFILSWWWYVCPHKQVCPFGDYSQAAPIASTTTPVVTEKKTAETPGRLVFNWSGDDPVTSGAFASFRDSILGTLGERDLLEIVGTYFSGETNNTSFANLGLARANKIRSLFGSLPDDRFDLKGSLLNSTPANAQTSPFIAAMFRKIINNEAVKEVDGRMVINFPHASDAMLENAPLNEYLDDLVAQLKTTDERVQLVGHTDSSSSAASNMRLGQKRANTIKNLLVNKGVESSRISTLSRGELEPIASNETDAGRLQNRRVELTVIK